MSELEMCKHCRTPLNENEECGCDGDTIERLTKERDELAAHVKRLKGVIIMSFDEATSEDDMNAWEALAIDSIREIPHASLRSHDAELLRKAADLLIMRCGILASGGSITHEAQIRELRNCAKAIEAMIEEIEQ